MWNSIYVTICVVCRLRKRDFTMELDTELETIIYCNSFSNTNFYALLLLCASFFANFSFILYERKASSCARQLALVVLFVSFSWSFSLLLQMKTTQQRPVTTSMILRSESSSSINFNRKNTATITFLQLNIGEIQGIRWSSLVWRFLSFQCFKFHSIVSVRAVQAIFELLLPVHRPSPTDTWCVADGSIYHFSAADIHSLGQRNQGDHRGFCKFQSIFVMISTLYLVYFNRNVIELMVKSTIER